MRRKLSLSLMCSILNRRYTASRYALIASTAATARGIYADWIGDHRPARAVAGVATLHFGLLIEVEALALGA